MRNTIKLLGLSALALGVMAFAASAAQATTEPPEWMVNGVDVTLNNPLPAQLKNIHVNGNPSLLATSGLTPVKIQCTEIDLVDVLLLPHGKLSPGKAKFLHCQTYLNGSSTPSANCKPNSPGEPAETITSEEGTGQLELVGGVPVTKLTSTVEAEGGGSLFAVIELGELCSVGEFTEVTGSLTAKDSNSEGEVESEEHEIEEGPGTSLEAFGRAASIDGSTNVGLTGEHEGEPWSGLAG